MLAQRASVRQDRDAARRARELLEGLTERQCPQKQRWLAVLP
jgi:hypothetical protein